MNFDVKKVVVVGVGEIGKPLFEIVKGVYNAAAVDLNSAAATHQKREPRLHHSPSKPG